MSFNEQTIDLMFDLANSVKNNPYIIEMKKRIEKGDIEQNIANELDRLRYLNKEFPQHPPTKELIWLLVNYIFGNLKRLKTIIEKDIETKPKNEYFLNIVKSYELIISFMLDKGLIDSEKLKEEIEIFKIGFPDDKATKFAERALNNYLSKKTPPPMPLHFSGKITEVQLKKLYTGLTTGGYLPLDPENENYKAFIYVFGGIGSTEDYKPLDWQKSVSLLAYMIDNLFGDTDSTRKWEITHNCFLKNEKKPNKNTLKKVISDIEQKIKDKPKGYEALDLILSF